MIDRTHKLPVVRQCQILRLARLTVYYSPKPTSPGDLAGLNMGEIIALSLQKPLEQEKEGARHYGQESKEQPQR